MSGTGIIFDMDGTLWDSSREVAASWSEVLRQWPGSERTAVTVREIRAVMGMTMTQIGEVLFPGMTPEERGRVMKACTDWENKYLEIHGGELYPALEETLQILARTYPLFIVSNSQSGYIEAFLAHYSFGRYFQDILCFGDSGLPKADNIRMIAARNYLETYYYVGDIQGDYDATAAAGGRFIHAAYGFGTIRQQVPAIHAFRELPELVKKLEAREDL